MAAAPALDSTLAAFAEAFADPFAAARAFKAAGGKVVGYMSPHAPVELIEAAGMLAVRLDGGGLSETPRADEFVEALFDPSVRAVCERLVTGELSFIDALILPRTTDSVQRFYYYLCERQRTTTDPMPRLLLYDLLLTPWYSSAEHSYRSLLSLRDALSEVAGRPIDDASISAALVASDERRGALQACLEVRRREPAGITGAEVQHVLMASRTMQASTFVESARELPAGLKTREAPARGVRLVIAGNCPDTTDLHAALEAAGAIIVGDYHDRGEPTVGPSFDRSLPPLRAISEHYQRRVLGARTFPTDANDIVRFAQGAVARGVVFFYFREEEVLTWDYPQQQRALAAAGIPSFCLTAQPYRIDAAVIQRAVAPFIADLAKLKRAS